MKVYGIGLPRTGTTSLCMAARRLGWTTMHGPNEATDVSDDVNALFADTPFYRPSVIESLASAGSMLIWTFRDYQPWRLSMLEFYAGSDEQAELHPADRTAYTELFGDPPFPLTNDKLARAYGEHHRAASLSGALRVDFFTWSSIECWRSLAILLGEFPRVNRITERR